MKRFLLQSAAAAAILAAAGCSAPSTTNDQVGAENSVGDESSANGIDENAPETAVAVARPPAAPAGLSADDAAPLGQATQIASEIDSEADVERVPFEGGWAWRRNGQILRTSSRDGSRISYFRPGESAPFFVQQGEESFAYSGGRVRRAYDRGGHAAPVAPARQGDAQRLADQSRREHGEAQHAPRPPQRGNDGRDRSDEHGAATRDRAATPGQTPSNGNSAGAPADPGRDRNGRTDRRRDRPSAEDQANRMERRTP